MAVTLAVMQGRATLVVDGRCVDIERRSGGRFGSDPMALYGRFAELAAWARDLAPGAADPAVDATRLDCPVPRPSQVFGIGLNYRSHAAESNMPLPETPLTFTKFPSAVAGPRDDIQLVSDRCDWEVELVVVIGRGGRRIPREAALDVVAGYTIGQDISERRVQFAGMPPQFSLGKSFATFAPIGPWVVSLDAVADPHDLALSCDVSGERMQEGRTADLIFSVPDLIAYLSGICELRPGDLIFTGTPSGVGAGRQPPRFLRPGDVLVSTIAGIGTMTNRCVAAT